MNLHFVQLMVAFRAAKLRRPNIFYIRKRDKKRNVFWTEVGGDVSILQKMLCGFEAAISFFANSCIGAM